MPEVVVLGLALAMVIFASSASAQLSLICYRGTGFGDLILSSEVPAAVSAGDKLATTWSHIKSR